jgi:membrane protein implicated in regulation of membrane protease activity
MIGLVVVVVLTVIAIVWRIWLRRLEHEADQVSAAWRDEQLRGRRDG